MISDRLAKLRRTGYADLLEEWRRLFRVQAPKRMGRDLLILGISWKRSISVFQHSRPVRLVYPIDCGYNPDSQCQ